MTALMTETMTSEQNNVASLRCASGGDEGDTCLSDAQIAALNVMNSDLKLSYSLASGETEIAGYNIFAGVDLTVQAVQDGKVAALAIDRRLRAG